MNSPALEIYRTIGPFDRESVPDGLLREHRLKEGSWGRITVLSGCVGLAWDDAGEDATGDVARIEEGDTLLIPPLKPHHLVVDGEFELKIDFLKEV